MSSTHGDRDESMYAGEGGESKERDPAHRAAGRGKLAAVVIGAILAAFVALFAIFMLASSNDGEPDAPSGLGAGTAVVLHTTG